MSVHLSPEKIESESFRIIEDEVGQHQWLPAEWQVVRRAIHASADFEYARSMVFSSNAIAAGIAALRAGCGIVTDTNMALSGIAKPRLERFGVSVTCYVADPDIASEARSQRITRSILAMRKGVSVPGVGIFIIGNAPTALFELLRLIRGEKIRPALIIGLPVGFVGAAESKAALIELAADFPDLPFITNQGRKGGSNVAAAVTNALLIMAQDKE